MASQTEIQIIQGPYGDNRTVLPEDAVNHQVVQDSRGGVDAAAGVVREEPEAGEDVGRLVELDLETVRVLALPL